MLIAETGVLFQQLVDDAFQFRRNPGIALRRRWRRSIEDLIEDRGRRRTHESRLARQGFVDDDTQGKQVGP